ncbi:hemolysin family protein [Lederbergia galactosidilytica]|uniref:Membrane protein n=1 Tax=Lederbergia galactosidilytica TaxID=217031 RepID=A0A178A6A2_9BACI|nr:hemolysin family protein [Lederbergia galactosidilytica]KRG16234.1 membrane protein [Virgibacillus soli]OAK75662.1 membrane protein [Lederbergia galactosidilytica]
MLFLNIFLVILLIALTAFFVASEFAIVKVRSSRIDQLIAEGNSRAITTKKLLANLDGYLSATQLGITVAALGLGWLGEPTVQALFKPIFEKLPIADSFVKIISFVLAFTIVTFFNVVVGELAPKTIAIQKAEQVAIAVSAPLIFFYKIMYPFIWILNHSARFIVKLFGFKHSSENEIAHSEEELRIILSESLKSGEINQSEYRYVNKIFEFDNRIAKEIMVPRVEVYTIERSASIEEILETIRHERFTRYPVIDGDKDSIIGLVNVKEFLTDCIHGDCLGDEPITAYVKPIIRVIETIPIQSLLVKMQKERTHMAVLLDEYGGTAGIITVEDILEEIVGEIRDEFDSDELPEIREIAEDHYVFEAKLLIEEVNDILNIHLLEDEVDTIGGWLLTQKYDLHEGDIIEADGYQFKVQAMEGSHISTVEVRKV